MLEKIVSKRKKIPYNSVDYIMLTISYVFTGLFAVICIIPFIYVISYSFTPYYQYLMDPMRLIPESFTLAGYKEILNFRLIWTGYRTTIFLAVVGTICSMIFLVIVSYPVTKKHLKGRNLYLILWIITMFFGGGMIANYYVMRSLRLINSLWVLILPGLTGTFNIILMKNYIIGLPASLEEAALIDGANDVQVLFMVVIPLCLPILATLGLFSVVGYWNSWFGAIIYITNRDRWPLQLVLREIVVMDITDHLYQSGQTAEEIAERVRPFTIQMAAIIVATLPILFAYPFLQKYFMKGLVLGGIKE